MPTPKYDSLVPIPAPGSINSGMNSCGKALQKHFGKPGALTKDCSPVTNAKLKKILVTQNVGPFRVTGIKPAVESLTRIFALVNAKDPGLYTAIETAGMLCCRRMRTDPTQYSNHSWGGAIDLYCGSGVVQQGNPVTHLGVFRLYPYFHAEGWYWGAEFSSPDAMHYECSAETVAEWIKDGLL